MAKSFRWGVLGTGGIARKFAAQLPQSKRGKLEAVGSRSPDSAERFAKEFEAGAQGDYQNVLDNPKVDGIYISLPNSLHFEWTIRALQAGKHVLCEKPIASRTQEAISMFDTAEANDRLLVEAFMYRTHPAVKEFIALVQSGAIGEPRLIRTHFTFNRPASMSDIRYHKELAGGSLMDVGCYCVNLSRAIAAAEPVSGAAAARMHEGGVDQYAVGTLQFATGLLSSFSCGMTVEADRTTFVCGDEGYVSIDTPWFTNGVFQLHRGDEVEEFNFSADQDLYALEADAFVAATEGEQLPAISPDDSIGNMRTLDQLRRSAGLDY